MFLMCLVALMTVRMSCAQPSSTCQIDGKYSCTEELAGRERYAIMDKLDVIAARLAPIDDIACGFPGPHTSYWRYEYKLMLDRMAWNNARQTCYRCGYGIARIESQAELDHVTEWMGSLDQIKSQPFIWMDGTNEVVGNQWVWTHPTVDRVNGSYTAWLRNVVPPGAGCMTVSMSIRRWVRRGCIKASLPFLCKRPRHRRVTSMPDMAEVNRTLSARLDADIGGAGD